MTGKANTNAHVASPNIKHDAPASTSSAILNKTYDVSIALLQFLIPVGINAVPYIILGKFASAKNIPLTSIISGAYFTNYILPSSQVNDAENVKQAERNIVASILNYMGIGKAGIKNFVEGEVIYLSYQFAKLIRNILDGGAEINSEAFLGCDILDIINRQHPSVANHGMGIDDFMCEYLATIPHHTGVSGQHIDNN
jgi:hypothetical protein